MSSGKQIAKNTMYLYIRMFFVMLVSLYTVRVLLAALGQEDYGLYNVVGGIVVMLSFLTHTLTSASQRFYAYNLGKNDFEQLIAQRPFAGTGITFRFSTRLIPSMMRIAYGPVHVKAHVNIASGRPNPYLH